jgi:ferredoxin
MVQNNEGLVISRDKVKRVTLRQKFGQWWYGVSEPFILRYADFMLKDERRRGKYVKMKKPKSLPSGIILSTDAACRFVDFIYSTNSENGSARMAVTACVCQTALKVNKKPRMKDMALLYAADMYTTLKHTGIKEKFTLIETAEEAKEMLRSFDRVGLLHNVLYCHGSGKWTFVMCNCDDEICVPYRSYMAGRTEEFGAGPEIISYDMTKCLGVENCGKCQTRCVLKACSVKDEVSHVYTEKCLGCGLCISTCEGGARTLVPRKNYRHEDVLTTKILLGK